MAKVGTLKAGSFFPWYMSNLHFSKQIPNCVTQRKKRFDKDYTIWFLRGRELHLHKRHRGEWGFSELGNAACMGTNQFRNYLQWPRITKQTMTITCKLAAASHPAFSPASHPGYKTRCVLSWEEPAAGKSLFSCLRCSVWGQQLGRNLSTDIIK